MTSNLPIHKVLNLHFWRGLVPNYAPGDRKKIFFSFFWEFFLNNLIFLRVFPYKKGGTPRYAEVRVGGTPRYAEVRVGTPRYAYLGVPPTQPPPHAKHGSHPLGLIIKAYLHVRTVLHRPTHTLAGTIC